MREGRRSRIRRERPWLPLYHDMGLIACLYFPLWAGIPSLHFPASDWLFRPELPFRYIQQYRFVVLAPKLRLFLDGTA